MTAQLKIILFYFQVRVRPGRASSWTSWARSWSSRTVVFRSAAKETSESKSGTNSERRSGPSSTRFSSPSSRTGSCPLRVKFLIKKYNLRCRSNPGFEMGQFWFEYVYLFLHQCTLKHHYRKNAKIYFSEFSFKFALLSTTNYFKL